LARFLSPEWVAERNSLLAQVDLEDPETEQVLGTSLAALRRRFRVREVVHGVPPDGADRVLDLVATDTAVALELVGMTPAAEGDPVTATIHLAYADAAALSRSELDPARALAEGRVKVRGDLALLIAAQGLLAQAARIGAGHVDTTY